MKFVKLTSIKGQDVLIHVSAITGMVQHDNKTRVYVLSDSFPFEVKESAEDIVHLISKG